MRLVGTRTYYASEGRVEVHYNGQWRSVCGSLSSFATEEAITICRQLGYSYVKRTTSYYGFSSGSITAYVHCSGSQGSLNQCSIGTSSCSSSYRQYVHCRDFLACEYHK